MSAAMIEAVGVTKRFGGVTAVDAVDLTVGAGEFLTLLGPSGCGKTTFLRMVSGFETPDSGVIRIDGADALHLPPERRPVNQVFQSYALFPHMSVGENVAFGLRMKKMPRAEIARRVADALALVDLTGFRDRMPAKLSGGQRQRVALARAIVLEPKVLLLDEPLSALDARLRRQMQIELKHLQRRLGITFVFVTHDQDEALTMSDRIAVFHRGRIVQIGTAEEVYRRPRTLFVATFVGDVNLFGADGHDGGTVPAFGSLGTFIPGKTRRIVACRPEDIEIEDAAAAGPNTRTDAQVFPGTVREVIFRGATATIRVDAAPLGVVTVLRRGAADAEQFAPGRSVFLRLAAEELRPLEDDGSVAAPAE